MLLRFAVSNFRSIHERIELTLEKSKGNELPDHVFTHPHKPLQLLKTAVLYGANASGKSNLLRAIDALTFLVNRSSGFKPQQAIPIYEPHKLRTTTWNQAVTFEIAFVSQGEQYEYLISFSQHQIEHEVLYIQGRRSKMLLFERVHDQPIKFGDAYKGQKRSIEHLLLKNQLFLSKAAENNVEVISKAYAFLSFNLLTFQVLDETEELSLTFSFAQRFLEDDHFRNKLNHLVGALDTGIVSLKVEKRDIEVQIPEGIPPEVRAYIKEMNTYRIKTLHENRDENGKVHKIAFDLEEESNGTQSLLPKSGIILHVLEKGGTLIIDELERSLHPDITRYLIHLFHSPLTNPHHAQLVFATHDLSQLTGDAFRRDQVWFVEKDEFGATRLFRASNLGIRADAPLDKWYASGRLGGTPIINDGSFFIQMQEHEPQTA